MRLPTRNRRQESVEDVRAFHEQMWMIHQCGGRYAEPVTEEDIASRRYLRR